MAKALFLSLPLAGHTNATLPLVRELVGGGDEIVYYSSDSFAARIEQAGGGYRPYRNAFLADMASLPDRMEELAWLLMRTTDEVLDQELGAFRKERPDYLITDSIAPWGQWIGGILGVPVVTSVPTFAFNRSVLGFGMKHGVRPKSARILLAKLRHMMRALQLLRRLRRKHGVHGPSFFETVSGRSGLNIVYTSRYFQPCAETFDQHFEFVGPSMASRAESIDFTVGGTMIYISLGTLFNADSSFYRKCFDAFRDDDFQVILSTGSRVSPESLGTAPRNFIVRSHVPQLDVLQRAAAFVTHGGMNSVSESLYYGVPVLVIPHLGEQALVGRRAEGLGAGLYLDKDAVTPDALRELVRRLLSESGFRLQASKIAESFKTAGGVARAASAIRRYSRIAP